MNSERGGWCWLLSASPPSALPPGEAWDQQSHRPPVLLRFGQSELTIRPTRDISLFSVLASAPQAGWVGHLLFPKAVGVRHTEDAQRMNMGFHYRRTLVIVSGAPTV